MTRRSLLIRAAGVMTLRLGAADMLHRLGSHADADPESAARDEEYWGGVRRAYTGEADFLYLNHGGISPTGDAVVGEIEAHIREANRAPAYHIYRKQEKELEAVRKRLAVLFGCDPEELAVMRNASQGLFTSIMGVPLSRGDAAVCTDQDYPRVMAAFAQRQRRDGIDWRQVTVPAVPGAVAELGAPLEDALLAKPKFLAFPRVGYLNGNMFPAKEICGQARKQGTITLVNGAHGIGQLPDSAALGSDLYACCLHKWILGPLGSGFLYVRRELIPDIWPLCPADEDLSKDIRKFEQFGTRNTGVLLAVTRALDAHEAIGMERKAARLRYLRAYWTSRVRDLARIRFYTPLDEDLSRALTTVGIDGVIPSRLADWLFKQHRIFVTTAVRGPIQGVRVSPQIFTTPSELDRLVSALRLAATKGIDAEPALAM